MPMPMSLPSQKLAQAIELSRAGVRAVLNGDHQPIMALYSLADDVTIGNPFGPFALGREATARTIAGAAARYDDGEIVGVDRIALHESDDLACVVEVERFRVKVGGSPEPAPVALRVTTLFRREDGDWKIVHRHADPITTPQPTESILQP